MVNILQRRVTAKMGSKIALTIMTCLGGGILTAISSVTSVAALVRKEYLRHLQQRTGDICAIFSSSLLEDD